MKYVRIDAFNLSEEDLVIVQLKDQGMSDEVISRRLRELGLMRYQPTSVRTRYRRLQEFRCEQTGAEFDGEETDWHDGDVSGRYNWLLYATGGDNIIVG